MSAYRTNSEPPFSEKIDNFKRTRKKFKPTEGLIVSTLVLYTIGIFVICLLGGLVSWLNLKTFNYVMEYIFLGYLGLGILGVVFSILFSLRWVVFAYIKHWKESFVDEQN